MVRSKLKDRILPSYTNGEEIFNMVSHIVGGVFGIAALVLCVVFSAFHHNPWAIVGSSIYGFALVLLYTMSSIYHGLHSVMAKKVMQIFDHCAIYILIAGTYTPIIFCSIRQSSLIYAWVLFGLVWGISIIGIVFTAIDLKKYSKLSMACYIGIGWSVILAIKPTLESIELRGFLYLLAGGIAYTIGAVLYGLGKKQKYMHCIFHVFVLIGSILQFVCILFYVI